MTECAQHREPEERREFLKAQGRMCGLAEERSKKAKGSRGRMGNRLSGSVACVETTRRRRKEQVGMVRGEAGREHEGRKGSAPSNYLGSRGRDGQPNPTYCHTSRDISFLTHRY